MLSSLQLPFRFDVARLQNDLLAVLNSDWTPHYNAGDFGGRWRGAALRSVTGEARDIGAGEREASEFRDTPLLNRCPYIRESLAVFRCPLKSVRLLALAPDSYIKEHSDNALDFEDGEVRIHIPIQTNSGAEFYLSGERLLLAEGGCYYVNVNLPHRVNNRGATERVHLVIDAAVNDWLRELFLRADAAGWRIPREAGACRVDEFRRYVLGADELRRRLQETGDARVFADEAMRLARESGYEFTPGDLDSCRQRALSEANVPEGWTPARVRFADAEPHIEWVFTGGGRPFEPFFSDTLRKALRNPFAQHFRVETGVEAAAQFPQRAPAGLIFHVSRCGSTLAANMFAEVARLRVFSEPPAFDHMVQARWHAPEIPAETHANWLRFVATALAQSGEGAGATYILKLDSWHIHELPLIRAAFPETPWIFLTRDAAEVAASQLRSPGLQGAPGAMHPRILRMTAEDITGISREEWPRRVVEKFLEAASAHREDAGALFLDYRELPEAIWERAAPHFGIELTADERERMREAARYDSKQPGALYQAS